jgi:hypothetical protein
MTTSLPDPPEQFYTCEEMAVIAGLVNALQEQGCALFTGASLPDYLNSWQRRMPEAQRAPFATGLVKLRQEPHDKLAAWLAGKATWLNIGDERFRLAYVQQVRD